MFKLILKRVSQEKKRKRARAIYQNSRKSKLLKTEAYVERPSGLRKRRDPSSRLGVLSDFPVHLLA